MYLIDGENGREMVHTYMADNAKYVVKHKALVASLTLRTHDAYTKLQTLEIHARFLDLEEKAASVQGVRSGGARAQDTPFKEPSLSRRTAQSSDDH